MAEILCPKCGKHNVRAVDNESLYHPTKQEVKDGLLNYDNDVYIKFVCDEEGCDNNHQRFTKVFKLIPQTEFKEGELNTPSEHYINSLIMEQASEIAEKLTELECELNNIKCCVIEMEGDTETSYYTKDAQEIFDIHYDEQFTRLYDLFNRQLKVIQ